MLRILQSLCAFVWYHPMAGLHIARCETVLPCLNLNVAAMPVLQTPSAKGLNHGSSFNMWCQSVHVRNITSSVAKNKARHARQWSPVTLRISPF